MGYTFRGFFTTDEPVAHAAILQWPLCQLKPVSHVFQGFAVRSPNEYDVDPIALSNEEYEEQMNEAFYQQSILEDGLPLFSKKHPSAFLSFLDMDSFGGVSMYRGFVLLDGEKLLKYEEYEEEESAFLRIMEAMSNKFTKYTSFPPVTKDFWR